MAFVSAKMAVRRVPGLVWRARRGLKRGIAERKKGPHLSQWRLFRALGLGPPIGRNELENAEKR